MTVVTIPENSGTGNVMGGKVIQMRFTNPRVSGHEYALIQRIIGGATWGLEIHLDSGSGWSYKLDLASTNTVAYSSCFVDYYDTGSDLKVMFVYVQNDQWRHIMATITDAGSVSISLPTVLDDNVLFAGFDRNGYVHYARRVLTSNKGQNFHDIYIYGTTTTLVDVPSFVSTLVPDFDPSVSSNNPDSNKSDVLVSIRRYASTKDGVIFAKHGKTGVTSTYSYSSKNFTFNGSTYTWDAESVTVSNTTSRNHISGIVDSADNRHYFIVDINSTSFDPVSYKATQTGSYSSSNSILTVSATNIVRGLCVSYDDIATDELYFIFIHGDGTDNSRIKHIFTPVDTISWGSETTLASETNNLFSLSCSKSDDGDSEIDVLWFDPTTANWRTESISLSAVAVRNIYSQGYIPQVLF